MRAALVTALVCAACTPSAGVRPSGELVDLRPRLAIGSTYEVLHRETQVLEGSEPEVLRTRTLLEVREALADGGLRMRAHIVRSLDDSAEDAHLVSTLVDFDVSPSGQLLGDPSIECGAEDDLRVPRFLRYLLGARAIVADDVGAGSTWRSLLVSDAIDLSQPAIYRLDALHHGTAEGRLSGRVRMERGDVGALRVTGEGRVRGRFRLSLDDGFSGRTTLDASVRGAILDTRAGVERRGTVRTRTELLVRPAAREEAVLPSCVFDSNLVVRALRLRQSAIQRCYERLLASTPALSGRVVARFRIEVGGNVRVVSFPENTTGSAPLAECVGEVVRGLRFRPGPVGGAVTYAFPFVFVPSR